MEIGSFEEYWPDAIGLRTSLSGTDSSLKYSCAGNKTVLSSALHMPLNVDDTIKLTLTCVVSICVLVIIMGAMVLCFRDPKSANLFLGSAGVGFGILLAPCFYTMRILLKAKDKAE
jgi:hypothetical protein